MLSADQRFHLQYLHKVCITEKIADRSFVKINPASTMPNILQHDGKNFKWQVQCLAARLPWDVKILSLNGNPTYKTMPIYYVLYNHFLWTGQKKATVAGGFKTYS
jgi:hypothetical protein